MTSALIGLALLLVGIAVPLAAMPAIERWLQPFVAGVRGRMAQGIPILGAAVRELGALNGRLVSARYEAKLVRSLLQAGEPHDFQAPDVVALQQIGLIAGFLFGLWFSWTVGLGWWIRLLVSLSFGLFGGFYPLIWLRDQVKRRHLRILRALPYNLDLITLSVEAGLDFASAVAKVVEKGKPGPLADELQLVLKELRIGVSREDALKSLNARVDLPRLTTIVNALIQANKMGTSLGKVLRIQATQLRIDRTHRAEKLAGEAPVKMLFPLLFFILPTILMVLWGPVAFAIVQKLM